MLNHPLPADFIRNIEHFHKEGKAWLQALPSLLEDAARRWNLTLGKPFLLSVKGLREFRELETRRRTDFIDPREGHCSLGEHAFHTRLRHGNCLCQLRVIDVAGLHHALELVYQQNRLAHRN